MFLYLLVFPLILTNPFDLGKLSVIDAFLIPIWIFAQEISPAAIRLLVLASCAVKLLLAILDVGGFHDHLKSEKSGMVSLLSCALQLVCVVNPGF